MRIVPYSILCLALLSSCFIGNRNKSEAPAQGDYLICHWTADEEPFYLNQNGDTIIPIGKYEHCFTDTIYYYGCVIQNGKIIAIDAKANYLFDVFVYDNGPDYTEDGLFRIIKDGKIGYANEYGEIVIEPKYQCAYPFEKGKAQVAVNCTETIEFEMKKWESTEWITIDKNGRRLDK